MKRSTTRLRAIAFSQRFRTSEYACVTENLEPFALPTHTVLYEANTPISHVYFPTSGCVSMVNVMQEGAVEVGTIGFEGFAGLPLLLDDDRMPTRAFVQLTGSSYRMQAALFENVLAQNPTSSRAC